MTYGSDKGSDGHDQHLVNDEYIPRKQVQDTSRRCELKERQWTSHEGGKGLIVKLFTAAQSTPQLDGNDGADAE